LPDAVIWKKLVQTLLSENATEFSPHHTEQNASMDNIGGSFVLRTDAASWCLPLYGLPM
jgi:hypothetical protein